MMTKAEKTKAYILEKVRPVFNKKGYTGTSLSDIVDITGLTKGAIYGNFKNKEELALASFDYNVDFVVNKIRDIIHDIESPLARLYAITNFYRDYYAHNIGFGGCPILNVGIDTNHTNPLLFTRVKSVFIELQKGISKIILDGQDLNEIKKNINAEQYGSRILSLIEGAVFTSTLLRDDSHLMDMMNHLDNLIKNEIQN
jgi:AcrR family transcriptional regulator